MPMRSSGKARRTTSRRVWLDASLLAAALMLSYLEHLLPLTALLPLPGLKLGLANTVTVLAFALLSPADALTVSLLRVCITGVLFGSWTSFLFSLCGALASFLALLLARLLLRRCSYIGVSVLCAAAHDLGQTLALALLVGVPSGGDFTIALYPSALMILLIPLSILCGTLTGVILNGLVPRAERWFKV